VYKQIGFQIAEIYSEFRQYNIPNIFPIFSYNVLHNPVHICTFKEPESNSTIMN